MRGFEIPNVNEDTSRLSRVQEDVTERIQSILDSFKSLVEEQKRMNPEMNGEIDNVGRLLLLKGERDLRYWMRKRKDTGETFLKEFSISADFFRRKFFELLELLKDIPKEGSVLDFACGTGDVAILLAMRGQKSFGVEIDPGQVRMGRFYAKQLGIEIDIRQGNIINGDLPQADHWVAKHPCAKNMALPDAIISRWSKEASAHKLVCMTCCQGKAQDSFPSYEGMSAEQWKGLCKQSDWTNNKDPEKQRLGHEAMDAIDEKRISFLSGLDLQATLKKVENTIKGNVIIAEKASA